MGTVNWSGRKEIKEKGINLCLERLNWLCVSVLLTQNEMAVEGSGKVLFGGTPGEGSNGDGMVHVAKRIRTRDYESWC